MLLRLSTPPATPLRSTTRPRLRRHGRAAERPRRSPIQRPATTFTNSPAHPPNSYPSGFWSYTTVFYTLEPVIQTEPRSTACSRLTLPARRRTHGLRL